MYASLSSLSALILFVFFVIVTFYMHCGGCEKRDQAEICRLSVTDITGFYELPYRPQKVNDTDVITKNQYKKIYV